MWQHLRFLGCTGTMAQVHDNLMGQRKLETRYKSALLCSWCCLWDKIMPSALPSPTQPTSKTTFTTQLYTVVAKMPVYTQLSSPTPAKSRTTTIEPEKANALITVNTPETPSHYANAARAPPTPTEPIPAGLAAFHTILCRITPVYLY